MSNLPGNPFATIAEEQESVAHALLALAYEQRTANMIAACETIEDTFSSKEWKKIGEMKNEIRNRIGFPRD